MTATIFNIQRCSVHDGPGIRTTVFLKGCNMRCAWCHNPESFLPLPQISLDLSLCSNCGQCAAICENGGQQINPNRIILKGACKACGKCVSACPNKAISIIGREYTVADVMDIVRRDKQYYLHSGGGVTCSGGEPTMQFEFLSELFSLCKSEGISTCLETNGLLNKERLHRLAAVTDLFLVDFKHSDEAAHIRYTGVSNSGIFDTLRELSLLSKPVVLRCPILPQINDTLSHFEAIHQIKAQYSCIEKIELMPYHNTGVSKWEKLAMEYTMHEIIPPTESQKNQWDMQFLE